MGHTIRSEFSILKNSWTTGALPPLDSPRTLVLAFGAPSLMDNPQPLLALREHFPMSHVLGCSTAGEINGTSVKDDTLSVAVTRFDATDLVTEVVRVDDASQSHAAGAELGARLAKKPGLRAVFVLSEGLKVNGSELIRGCNAAVGGDVIVTGGLSGDGARFQRTWVTVNGAIGSGLVAAVGFYGDHIVVTHGSRGGWDQFGPERLITRSTGNVIHEIDHQPALLLYKKYLGDKAKDLPGSGLLFPLEMRRDEQDEQPLVRTLLAVDEAAQSLTFAGDTPQGHRVRLMKANFDRLVDGAATAATAAAPPLTVNDGGCLAVAVSCVGRRLVLGARIEEEVEATQGALPKGTEIVGFYSYGELSPFVAGEPCELHNQTMTVTTFSESKTPLPRGEPMEVEFQSTTTANGWPADAGVGQLQTFEYALKDKTWSVPTLPALDSPRTLVVAFGATAFLDDQTALKELRSAYPSSHVVACSTSGEIAGTTVKDDTLSVAAFRFEHTTLRTEVAQVNDASQSSAAGKMLGAKLAQTPGLRAVFVLSEGLKVNGSELVRGINDTVGPQVIVTGGLSGDGPRFQRTWVSVNGQTGSGLIAAVGLYGDHIQISHGSRGGWDEFGPERLVTRSVGNVIYEIDNEPALSLYKKYLGDKAKDLPGSGLLFPLQIRRDEHDDKPLVRTLLAVDEAAQSLTFAGDTPQGHRVRLMKANFDRLVNGAGEAADTVNAGWLSSGASAPAHLAVAISCVGRRLVLGQRTEDEVEATLAGLPQNTKMVGFYSYGELSPQVQGAACELHNQTMTVTMFSESQTPLTHEEPTEVEYESATAIYGLPADVVAGQLQTFEYALKDKTWSVPTLPALDSPRTLVVAFGATAFLDDQTALKELRSAYPSSHVVACSTSGEIAGTTVKDDTLSVAAFRFEHTTLRTEVAQVNDASQSSTAGKMLGAKLAQTPGLRAVFVLSEGLKVNGSELVRGINDAVGSHVIVTGGLSGDGPRFQRTWVSVNGQTGSGLIAAVGLYGDHIQISHGSRGGWDEFGPERLVTRSVGNVIYEIDNEPALSLYKKYLGDKAKDLPGSGLLFPLQIRRDEHDDKPLVRTLLAVDEAAQSLTFAGDTPQGHRVRLMKANFDRLVNGAGEAADTVNAGWLSSGASAPAHLAVAISCVGRRLVLGQRTEDEVEATLAGLPQNTKMVGFYSYGELSPQVKGAACELHNQTMTVTMFSESKTPLARPASAPAPARTAGPETMAATPARSPSTPPAPISAPPATAVGVALPRTQTQTPMPAAAPVLAPPISSPPAPPPSVAPMRTNAPPPPPMPASRSAAPEAQLPQATSLPPRPSTGRFDIPKLKKPQAYPPQRGSTANARVVTRRVGAVTIVGVTGRLAEGFKGRDLARDLSGIVVLDLLGVDRVTSYGVREWLAFLEEAGTRVSQLFLARCSEAIVAQLGMIRGFAGRAQILSVMAPYTCTCGAQVNGLLDLRTHGRDIALGEVPSPQCPNCGKDDTEFDDDPRGYFVFQSDRPPLVPPEVDEALATLEARAVEAVEKTVDATGTRVVVNAELDATIRWQRILDGIEGHLSIDLQGSPRTTPEGSSALIHALTRALTPNDIVEIIAAPQELLPMLDVWPAAGPGLVISSAFVEGFCPDCQAGRRILVKVADHVDALRVSRDPLLLCPRHSRPLDFTKVRPLLSTLRPRQAAPKPEPATLAPPLPVAAPLVAAAPAAIAVGPATTAPGAATAISPAGAVPRGTAIAWGAAAVGITVALVSFAMRPPTAPVAASVPSVAPVATAPSDVTTPPADALPPEWTARPLVIDEGTQEVMVVGKAGPERTKERLLEAATDDAVLRLVLQAERAARPTAQQLGDLNDDTFRERVRRRFDETMGVYAAPMRTDAFLTERPEGYTGSFRFKVPKAAYDKMVAELAETVSPLGIHVARIRITEAVALGSTDALVVVQAKTGAADPAAQIGDTIHAINGDRITDLQDFETRVRNGYRALAPGRQMTIVFGHGGGLMEKRWRKPLEPK